MVGPQMVGLQMVGAGQLLVVGLEPLGEQRVLVQGLLLLLLVVAAALLLVQDAANHGVELRPAHELVVLLSQLLL